MIKYYYLSLYIYICYYILLYIVIYIHIYDYRLLWSTRDHIDHYMNYKSRIIAIHYYIFSTYYCILSHIILAYNTMVIFTILCVTIYS